MQGTRRFPSASQPQCRIRIQFAAVRPAAFFALLIRPPFFRGPVFFFAFTVFLEAVPHSDYQQHINVTPSVVYFVRFHDEFLVKLSIKP
jgi:hypothetical protein